MSSRRSSSHAVVSTPYWHAVELLADGRGLLVPFRDSKAIAREVLALLQDEPRRHAIRKAAYKLGREMVWSSVARIICASAIANMAPMQIRGPAPNGI